MRYFLRLFFILTIAQFQLSAGNLVSYLQQFPQVVEIIPMTPNAFFQEAVQIRLLQPVDHRNPDLGIFSQRVFVSIKTPNAPVVLVTEGYVANYGANSGYLNELCSILEASQVVVEHRYFGQSWPDPVNWEFLTVENAAGDHHTIVNLLKPYLSGKWVNTGISKGGQTAVLHRVFHPEDVDLTVSYVAPFNFGVEDGRHEPFIDNIPGTAKEREKVLAFQHLLLDKRQQLMPLFSQLVADKNYTFSAPINAIYDYCVLEYSFAFWQWGSNPALIPGSESTLQEVFDHFEKISSPDYFAREGLDRIGSFFVQAARELGYYGYDTKPFKGKLSIESAEGYLARLFMPDNYSTPFDDRSVKKTEAFLDSTNAQIIFIYGANDPWTASGFNPPARENFLKIVQEGASHGIRIGRLDEKNQTLVVDRLKAWVSINEPVLAE